MRVIERAGVVVASAVLRVLGRPATGPNSRMPVSETIVPILRKG